MFTENFKEAVSLQGWITTASTNGIIRTSACDMGKFHRAALLGGVGTLGSGGTLDATLAQANVTTAASAVNIASTAITQITAANTKFSTEIRADQMTARYLFGVLVVGVIASVIDGTLIAFNARNKPANALDNDTANTQRIVSNL